MDKKLIPLCGWCKKIKPMDGDWQSIEAYLTSVGYTDITHGMCPECSEKIFQKRVYLESYQNICKAISSSLSLKEVLNLIVTKVVKVMNVKASLLRLVNKRSNTLDVAAYYGLSDDYVNKGSVKIDRSVDDALVGKNVSVYDIMEDEDSVYYREAKKEGIRSILSFPLRFKDEIIGVLRMYTAEPRGYTEEDMKFLAALAEQAAIAIMNAREFETVVSKEKEYLRLFREISRAVSSSLESSQVLSLIVEKTARAMNVRGAAIRLVDETTHELVSGAAHGISGPFLASGVMDNLWKMMREQGCTPQAVEGCTPVAIYDAFADARIGHKDTLATEGIKSILLVPINVRGRVIGILALMAGWFRNFTAQESDFVLSLAEQCGLGIENALMYECQCREASYLKTIREVTKLMSSISNTKEILDVIMERLSQSLNVKGATIRLVNPHSGKLELRASFGLSAKYLSRGEVDPEENIQLAMKGVPVLIDDIAADPRVLYREEAIQEGITSILAIPMIAYDTPVGVMRLVTQGRRRFTGDEIDFALVMADEAAVALESARTRRRVASEVK